MHAKKQNKKKHTQNLKSSLHDAYKNHGYRSIHTHSLCRVEGISGFDGRRGTPLSSASSPRTPASGGSLKIGRRSHERSKSPFRSFRWKRGSSKAADSDDEEGNKIHNFIRTHEPY